VRNKVYSVLSVLLTGASLLLWSTPASAAAGTELHRHCTITLAPIAPGEISSEVLGKTCVVETNTETRQRMASRLDVVLAVFWGDVDYSGDSTSIEGGETCDNEGYGISDMDDVHDEVSGGGVSSYQLLGSCDVSEKFTGYDFEGTSSGLIFGQNQSWVGATWNDGGIASFSMFNG
jgi:hypothetical protein